MATSKPHISRHLPGGLFGAVLQLALAEWRPMELGMLEDGAYFGMR